MSDRAVKCADIDDGHVIELARQWQQQPHSHPGVVAALVAEGVPEKVAVAKVERLVRRGLLDYGTTLRYAWPTEA